MTGAATNGFFAKLTKPLYAPTSVQSRANKLGLKMMTETDQLATTPTYSTGFQRFLFDEGHTAGMATKRFLQQGISEGLEEDIQYSIQKVNDAENRNRSFLESSQDLAVDFLTHGLDFSDDSRLEATALGSIMGAGGVPIMAAAGYGAAKEAKSVRDARELAQNELGKAYTDFMSSSILSKSKDKKGKLFTKEEDGQSKFYNETEDRVEQISFQTYQRIKEAYPTNDKGEYTVPGELPVDADGNVEIDKVKAASFAAAAKLHSEFDNYIDTEATQANADNLKISLYQLAKLKNLAQMSFKHGTTDLLIQKLDSYTKLSPEKLQRAGISNPEEIQATVDRWKKHIERLEANYLSTQNALITTGDQNQMQRYRDTVADVGGRIVNLDTLVEDVDNEIETLIAKSPIATRLRSVQEAFMQTNDVEPLFPYVSTDATTAEETKIAELSTKRKDLVAAREELGQLYSDMMQPKKGFKAYKEAVTKGALAGFGKTSRDKSKNISFSDTFSDVELNTYLDKTAQILQHADKVKVAKSAFFAGAINLFVKYLSKESYTVESAESLRVLTNKILDNKYDLYPDEVEKLQSIIVDFVKTVNDEYDALNEYFASIGESESTMDFFDLETEEQETNYNRWSELKDIKEALGNLDSNTQKVLQTLKEQEGFPKIETDEQVFRIQAAKDLLNSGNRIISASQWDGENISSEYDNTAGVRIEIDKLSTYINKGLIPLAKTNSAFKPVLAEAKRLHETLKKIEVKAKENKANKDLKNKLEDLHYAAGINSLAPETNKDLQELIKMDPVLAAMATTDILAKDADEVLAAKQAEIYLKAKELLEGLKVFELTSFPADFKITPEDVNIILKHPSKGFGGLFSLILRKESSTVGADQKNLTALENFVKDYDVVKFTKSLETFDGVTTQEQLQELLFIQTKLLGLQQIQQTKESGFNSVNFLNSIREYLKKNPTAPTPSSAQIRVVRELALFIMAPNKLSNEMYQNGAALKAPAGAGKSLVVSKLLKHILKLGGKDIITAAPQPLAAKNIKESLESTVGPFTVEELTTMLNNNTIDKNIKLVVVDEAGALLGEYLNKFAAAFAKYNRENPDNNLKFVLLYDPNQITPGNVATAALDRNFSAEPALSESAYWQGDEATRKAYRTGERLSNDHATLPFIENIQSISPLSVTYRSDVSEIVDLQNAFKTELPVESLETAASVNPAITTKDIIGSFAEKENTIAATFRKSEVENPSRTRSIIVGSQAKKDKYTQLLPNAEVLTAFEAQGITREEVYVDIEGTDGGALGSPKVLNAWMYTAISRATIYAHVSNQEETTFKVDREIPSVVEKISSAKESKNSTAIDTITQQIETLSKITEDVVVPEATPVAVAVDDVVEEFVEEEVETADEGLVEEPVTEELDEVLLPEGTHSLWNPTSEVMSSSNLPNSIPALTGGDTVVVVKDITPKQDGSPATRYLILQPIEEDGVVFAYRKVGILSEDEVTPFQTNLRIPNLAALEGYTFQGSYTGTSGLITPDRNVESSVKLIVQPTTKDITYVYSQQPTDDFSADVNADGTLDRISILKTYFESLYGSNPGEVIQDYADVLNNFDKHTKIISFRWKKDIREWFPNAISDKQRPRLGPPYLVLYNIKSAKTGKPMNNQFIRLVPSMLNKNTPDRADFPLSSMYQFLDKLSRFEDLLANSGLPGKYSSLKNGTPVLVGRESYYPFHSFVISMAKAYRKLQQGETDEVSLTDSDNLNGLFPTLQADQIPKELLELAYEIDILVHGDVSEGEARMYKGPAQKVIDAIGKQNFITTLPNGTNLILRDYRKSDYNSTEKREITHSAGLSLLGPIKYVRKKGLAYNALIKERLINKLKSYSDNLDARGLNETSRSKFVKSIINAEGLVHLNPVTTADLNSLFRDSVDEKGYFSKVSEGFGIRTPLGKEFDASTDSSTSGIRVKDVVQTHYVKTNPTRIVLGKTADIVAPDEVKEKEVKKLSPLQELSREIRDTKTVAKTLRQKYPIEVVAEFTSFMNEDTFEKAVLEYRKNSQKAQTTSANKNIYQSLKDVGANNKSLTEQIEQEIQNSLTVEGVGRDKGKIASRDYTRGAALVKLFGATSPETLMMISDLARIDFYSGKNRTPQEFTDTVKHIANSLLYSDTELVSRFNNLVKAYNEVNSSYKTNKPVKEAASVEDIFNSLAQIVELSSALRAIYKNTNDTALPLPKGALVDFAKKLVESAENEEEFESVLNHPDNAAFKAELSGLTTDEDYYDAATRVLEGEEFERSKVFEGMNMDLGEDLTAAEVEELMERIHPKTSFNLFKKFAKKKSNSEVYRMFKFGELLNKRGQKVWGLYKNGVLNFALNANGKIGSRTVRHEVFHKVFWEYLTPAEQVHVLNLAKQKWGNLSAEGLEEKLAVDFETFVINKKPSVFEVFWQKLMRLLGFTFNNLSSLEKFFSSIEGGVYSQKVNSGEVERSQINIAANFDNLAEYKFVKTALLSSFIEIEESRKLNNRVLSFSEIIKASFERLNEMRKTPELFFPQDTLEQLNYKKKAISKVLDSVSLSNSFVDTFFGQAQTKDTLRSLYNERQQRQLDDLLAQQKDLEDRIVAGEKLEDDLAKLNGDIGALSAETFDTELSDPSIKLTGNVKQRLISVKYLKDGVEDFAALGEAFSVILPRVASIPVDSMETALDALEKAFKTFEGISFKTPSNIRTATGRYMLGTIRKIQQVYNSPDILKNVGFRKDAYSKKLYAIVSTDNSPVGEITRRDVELNPNKYRIIPQVEGGTMHDLINSVAQLTSTPYSRVATTYYLFEDLDFVRSLLAAVSSLRESLPHIGIDEYFYGEYKTKYLRVKTGGGKQIHESYLSNKFDSYTRGLNGTTLFSDSLISKIRKASSGTLEEKKEALQEFLKLMDIKRAVTDITAAQLDVMFDGFHNALENMQEKFKAASNKEQSYEQYLEERRGSNLIKDEAKMLRNIVDVLNNHYQLSETHSYTRADGQKAYGWLDGSYQSQLLTSITRALNRSSKNLPFKKFQTFSFNPKTKRLVTEDRFLKDNIYFNGKSSILGFIDHDGLKTKGNDGDAKYLTKENLKDFRKRNIVFGFFSKLGFGSTYYQFLPIPSNRTTIQAVEVTALKLDELDDALTSIIDAQKNRPDPAVNPDLAATKTYVAKTSQGIPSWKQWKLAGLEGNVDTLSSKEALEKVKQHVSVKAKEIAKDFHQTLEQKAKLRIPENDLKQVVKNFKLGSFPSAVSKTATDTEKEAYFKAKNDLITKAIEVFYLNSIVNQYSASQLLYGDEAFYASKEDQTKRIQIVTATGDTLLTDSVHGIPPTSKILVVEDLKMQVPQDMEGVLADSYRDAYDASDAEGFMLPEFYEKIARTYGIESLTDIVMKPVYFSIENGIPTAVKYSVKVLTNELVEAYPHLGTYRDMMREAKADQLVFKSAVKVGLPSKLAKLNSAGELISDSVNDNTFLTINNGNLRFQLNPASDTDKDVANPSQGTAFMNTNGMNFAESFDLHKLNAFLISNGLRKVSRSLHLTRKGSMSPASKSLLTKRIISSLEGLPGGRDVLEMLQATDPQTKRKASLNLPLISERVVSTISSFISKSTTGFKFEGSKLVLQADLGEQELYNDTTKQLEVRKLQYRDKDGFCEVILPATYKEFMKKGDTFVPGNSNGLVGFRIPSTNYHSLMPLKVVGFYPVPEGSKGNMVIAPSLVVYYQGSDYDIDSLFVIRKEKHEQNDVDLNDLVSLYYPEHSEYHEGLVFIKNKTVTGFNSEGPISINGLHVHQYLDKVMNQISKQIETLTGQLSPSDPKLKLGIVQQTAVKKQIELLNEHLTLMANVAEASAKNHIVDLFSKNMLESKNRQDLLTPISFKSVKGLRSEMVSDLEEMLDDESFMEDLQKAGIINLIC